MNVTNRHRRCGTIASSEAGGYTVARLTYQLTEWVCKHPLLALACEVVAVVGFSAVYWAVLLWMALEYAM